MRSRLLDLLAEKRRLEKRRISVASVARELGISNHTIQGFAHSTLKDYPAESIVKLCGYFNCTVGDLLVIEEADEDTDDVPAA